MIDPSEPLSTGIRSPESIKSGFVTVVSGLPRSGTSMMMRMLHAGGMATLNDEVRAADIDNPRGYYEFEPAKRTKEDDSWLETASGKAVKMVYRLLYDLPSRFDYRVVMMRRDTREVLASQKAMLARLGSDGAVSDDVMARLFHKELQAVFSWLDQQTNYSVLEVDYNRMLAHPAQEIDRLNAFFDGRLDADAMCRVVEPALYRNRASV